MQQCAYIDPNTGEIHALFTPAPDLVPPENSIMGEHVVKHVPAELVGILNMEDWFWFFGAFGWHQRARMPREYYDWVAPGMWEFNSDKFLVALRRQRDSRLYACDWTQLADAPLSAAEQAAWASYRQALRDITNDLTNVTHMDHIQWPISPT